MVSVKGFKEWLGLRKQEQEMLSFAIGMNSSVDIAQDKHLIFLDYDIDDLDRVKRSVVELQQFWALADCHLFKTKHGYHGIFFTDLVPYSRLRMIIDYARDCDPMFRYISKFYSHKTLRVAGKYQDRDIFFETIIPGVRDPTEEELSLGELKRREHALMIGGIRG